MFYYIINYYLPPNSLFVVRTLVGGGAPHCVAKCGFFLVIVATSVAIIVVLAFGYLLYMGMTVAILIEAVIK